jgi:thiol:disulfide interchange protein DsbC
LLLFFILLIQGIIMRNMIIGVLLTIYSAVLVAESTGTDTVSPPVETVAKETTTPSTPAEPSPTATTPPTASTTTEKSTVKTTAATPTTTSAETTTTNEESTAKTEATTVEEKSNVQSQSTQATPEPKVTTTPSAATPTTTSAETTITTTTSPEPKSATTTTVVPTPKLAPEAVVQALKRIIKVDFDKVSITESAIKGLYEVLVGSEVVYVSDDGQHLIVGDIRDMKTGQNLTDNKRAQLRIKEIATLDEKEMIVFAPKKATKYTIDVFTDVDCPYCAKFHNEVPELNKNGVKVRYLAFPRAGAGSKTYKTMVSVWCAEDRQQAITDAKAGQEVKPTTCNNPIDKQYELGKRIGVSGTPAMLLSNGELVPGYVPAKRLITFLKRKLKN